MANKQPFVRITKKDNRPMWQVLVIKGIAVLCAMAVASVFIYSVTKLNPSKIFSSMWKGAFGSARRTWITLRDASFLLLIALGLTPAFKMRFWNTGGEGQILMGGLVSAAFMINFKDRLSSPVLLICMVLSSMIAGAVWGFIPAYFKAKYEANETLFTLMMNYVATQLVEFYVDIWDTKGSHSVGIINMDSKIGWLPKLLNNDYVLIILIALVIMVFIYIYLNYSKHGYEIAVIGESRNTAKYAGINVPAAVMRTMALSGAICGLGGFIQTSGIAHTISKGIGAGRGFTAIIVAWLSQLNPFIMMVFSTFLVFLEKGAAQIASDFNFNQYASSIVTGIMLLFILGSDFFVNYNLVFRKKEDK
mgnify:FL=1